MAENISKIILNGTEYVIKDAATQYHTINGMLTNFHLPKSTLLMMITALAGYDRIMAAYQEAVQERYRFFSFGDCMLLTDE